MKVSGVPQRLVVWQQDLLYGHRGKDFPRLGALNLPRLGALNLPLQIH